MKEKKFKLEVTKAELDLIVGHLNKGVYEQVAMLLSNLYGQVNRQLPKPKSKANGASPVAEELIRDSERGVAYDTSTKSPERRNGS